MAASKNINGLYHCRYRTSINISVGSDNESMGVSDFDWLGAEGNFAIYLFLTYQQNVYRAILVALSAVRSRIYLVNSYLRHSLCVDGKSPLSDNRSP